MTTSDAWDIVGHERSVDLLQRAIEHRRIGHAYLISGPLGVGKRTLALRLAQALNCERLGPGATPPGGAMDAGAMDAGASAEIPPCGACRRCRLIASDSHPEVRVVGVQPPSRVIRVADVESIQADASLRAADVYRKVYVLEQAELLHPDAANRLLKTIEEPPASVVMVLTTVDPEATLETIVSRCQHLRLRPLRRDRLARHLVERAGLASERAELVAALAEGCVGRALTLANDDRAVERRARTLDELIGLEGADRVARLQYARTLGDRWSKDADSVREVLQTWLRWWRDVLLLQGGLDDRIVNLDRRPALDRLARALSSTEAGAAVSSVRDALQMLDQNVNARLTLDVVTLDLPPAGAGGVSDADEARGVVPVGIRPAEPVRRRRSSIVWALPGQFDLKLGDRVWVSQPCSEWLGEVVVPSEKLVEWSDLGAHQVPLVVRRASDDEWPKPPDTAGRRLLASLDLPKR